MLRTVFVNGLFEENEYILADGGQAGRIPAHGREV